MIFSPENSGHSPKKRGFVDAVSMSIDTMLFSILSADSVHPGIGL